MEEGNSSSPELTAFLRSVASDRRREGKQVLFLRDEGQAFAALTDSGPTNPGPPHDSVDREAYKKNGKYYVTSPDGERDIQVNLTRIPKRGQDYRYQGTCSTNKGCLGDWQSRW
mmetsp:Transcript_88397/g.250527  ORF Transcript_88397/g.250527 Transcript_88397/m.250527 type:complete len:114 (-) Transcript_88397:45-386(-)